MGFRHIEEKSTLAGACDVSNSPWLGKSNIGTQWEMGYFGLSGVLHYVKGGIENKLERDRFGARLQRSLGAG